MNFSVKSAAKVFSGVLVCVGAALPAHGQFYKLHEADIAVGGIGQYTTSITNQPTLNRQATTDSTGFLLTLRDHPLAFAGVEVNYSYTRFTERFTAPTGVQLANVKNNLDEATGAYLFHPHFKHLQPFVGIGGGALFFNPMQGSFSQTRGTGLFEVGLDIPTSNPHFGFRVQGRSLDYRAPNYNRPALSSSRWVSTNEPSFSAYIRF